MFLEKLLKVIENVGFEGHALDRLSKKYPSQFPERG
jgi:hypothetical protein